MQISFVAGFGPIVRDTDDARRFWGEGLGIGLEEAAPGYWTNDDLEGVRAFALWPLSQAAQATFGTDAWPAELPTPQAWIELDVASPEAVADAVRGARRGGPPDPARGTGGAVGPDDLAHAEPRGDAGGGDLHPLDASLQGRRNRLAARYHRTSSTRDRTASTRTPEERHAHAHQERHDRQRRCHHPGGRPRGRRDDRHHRHRSRGQRRSDDRRDRQVGGPRRDRRPHPHGAAVRRHLRQGHLRDRDPCGGLRRDHHDHRLRRAAPRREPARGARRLACQGGWQRLHRLRLPHDHQRRPRRRPGRDGHPGRRGGDQLQAVHRLPGRLPQRRRRHLPRHAADRQERRADHDARRERTGHRRGRQPERGVRATPIPTTTA